MKEHTWRPMTEQDVEGESFWTFRAGTSSAIQFRADLGQPSDGFVVCNNCHMAIWAWKEKEGKVTLNKKAPARLRDCEKMREKTLALVVMCS